MVELDVAKIVGDTLCEALGGRNMVFSNQDTDFGGWTPNSIKAVIVGAEGVVVEVFNPKSDRVLSKRVRYSRQIVGVTGEAVLKSNPVARVLTRKAFRNIEEIVVDSTLGILDLDRVYKEQIEGNTNTGLTAQQSSELEKLGISPEALGKSSGQGKSSGALGNTRLRRAAIVAGPVSFMEIERVLQERGDMEVIEALEQLGHAVVRDYPAMPAGDMSYKARYSLNANIYKADLAEGELARYFTRVRDAYEKSLKRVTEGVKGSEDREEKEGEEGKSANHESLKEIMTRISVDSEADNHAVTIKDSSNKRRLLTNAYWNLLKDRDSYSEGIQQLVRAIFYIPTDLAEQERKFKNYIKKKNPNYKNSRMVNFLAALPQGGNNEYISSEADSWVVDPSNGYLGLLNEEKIAYFRKRYESLLGEKVGSLVVGGLEFWEQLYNCIIGNVSDESADETIIKYIGSNIGGKVQDILDIYDGFFEPVYDMAQADAVLIDASHIYNRKSGGDPQVVNLGGNGSNAAQGLLHQGIWHNIFEGIIENYSGSDKVEDLAEIEENTYLPLVIADIAFKKPIDGTAREQGISWGKYKDKYLKKWLQDVLRARYVKIVKEVQSKDGRPIDEVLRDDSTLNIVNERSEALINSLTMGVMAVDFNITGSGMSKKFVAGNLAVMWRGGLQIGPVMTGFRAAIQTYNGRGIDGVECTPSEFDKKHSGYDASAYTCFTVQAVADRKLNSASPLFAYKALEQLQKVGKQTAGGITHAIIGKSLEGKLLRAGGESGINFTNSFSHYILAKSRAGKGVMTMSLLANSLDGKTPVFYMDNKPDMASLLRNFNRDGFIINGNSIISNPEQGNDVFGQFTNEEGSITNEWKGALNTPQYIVRDGVLSSTSNSSLGVFYYMRGMILVMGIVGLRIVGADIVRALKSTNETVWRGLGGDTGIFAVFDEFENTRNAMDEFAMNAAVHMVGTGEAARLHKYLNKEGNTIEGYLEENPEVTQGAFWSTNMVRVMVESVNQLQAWSRAGANNEKLINNVMILGQGKVDLSSVPQISYQQKNTGAKVVEVSAANLRALYTGMTQLGNTADAFVGASEPSDDFLMASDPRSKAHGKLDTTARMFAYVSSIAGNNAKFYAQFDGKGQKEEKLAFAARQIYFKPFLLLEQGEPDSYSVREMQRVLRENGVLEESVALNEDPNNPGNFDPAVGFEGYLRKAGISPEAVAEQLELGARGANFLVQQILGYPGDWREFVYDMRPEWQLSLKDITMAINSARVVNGQIDTTPSQRFIHSKDRFPNWMQVYPLLFPDSTTAQFMEADGSDLNMPPVGNEAESGSGFGDFDDANSFAEEALIGNEMSPESFDTSGIPVEEPEEPIDGDEDSLINYITTLTMQKLAGSGSHSLKVDKNHKIFVNSAQVAANKAEAAKELNWERVLTGTPIEKLNISDSVAAEVNETMGWDKMDAGLYFKASPTLKEVTIGGSTYQRKQAQEARQRMVNEFQNTHDGATSRLGSVYGGSVPPLYSPMNNVEAANYGATSRGSFHGGARKALINWLNERPKAKGNGYGDAGESLTGAGISRARDSWKRGGAVKKGVAAAVGLAGVQALTGVAVLPLLLTPVGLGLIGIGTGIHLWRSAKRASQR